MNHKQHSINNTHEAIIKTLAYASVFEYPLSILELHKWLITKEKVSRYQIKNALNELSSIINVQGDMVFFRGCQGHVRKRKERRFSSNNKYTIALKASKFLSRIPTIKLIGISGSLSMNNADRDDDIDFFIITQKNSVWLSRFLMVLLLSILRIRRKAGEHYAKDKICLNMIIDEKRMDAFALEKNLYTAHEISQLKVLYQRGSTYQEFISENSWIYSYLANLNLINPFEIVKKTDTFSRLTSFIYYPLDGMCFLVQKAIMKKITNETVMKDFAAFHPQDKRKYIITLYKLRYKKLLEVFKLSRGNMRISGVLQRGSTPGY